MLQLHKCFKSVDISTSTLITTSGLVLSSRIPVEQLGLRLFHKRMTDDEYIDILKFSTTCPSLNLLGIYGSPPPKSFTVERILSNLNEKNVRVKYYGSCIESPVYNLNLLTGQWERTDGVQCTEEDFNQMELDFNIVTKMDATEIRRAGEYLICFASVSYVTSAWVQLGKHDLQFAKINEYRKQLSISATKEKGMFGNVDDDDSIEHGQEDIDIMAQLRIARNSLH